MGLTINGEEISDDLIEQEFSQIKGHYERTLQVACCERDDEFRSKAKKNITHRVLLAQEAKKRIGELPPETLEKTFQDLVTEHGSEKQLYYNLGFPYEDKEAVLKNIHASLQVEHMLQEVYQDIPAPQEEDLHRYHQAHIKQFSTEPEIRVSHVTKNLQGVESRLEVFEAMCAIREALLTDPEQFETLARQENSDPEQDIDLGTFKPGEFMEEFEAIAFSMRPHEISPVFSTQLGFHLCKVTERQESTPLPFAEAKEQVLAAWQQEAQDQQLKAFLAELEKIMDYQDDDPEPES